MSDKDFYIYLASDTGDFPSNTRSEFKVHLPQKLLLSSNKKWKCALVELSFVRSWPTINNDNLLDQMIFINLDGYVKGIRLTSGYYETLDQLCSSITNAIREGQGLRSGSKDYAIENDATFKEWLSKVHIIKGEEKRSIDVTVNYSSERNQVLVNKGVGVHSMWFNPTLRRLLGIGEQQWFTQSKSQAYGWAEADIKGGLDAIYVYTDLVDAQIVSNTLSPLLRVVGIPQIPFGERAVVTFDSPHYITTRVTECDTIAITLRSSLGELIPFARGQVFVKLHVRSERLKILL